MGKKLEEIKLKQKLDCDIFTDNENYMKNFHLSLERSQKDVGNILLVNTSSKIDIVDLLSENKILTIEVLNDKIKEILNKEISMNFFIKLIIHSEMRLNRFNEDNDLKKRFNLIKSKWEEHEFDTITLIDLFDLLQKVLPNNSLMNRDVEIIFYKKLSYWVGDFINDFIKSYENSDSMNPNNSYANILFNEKDLKIDDYPELFRNLKKYFLDPNADTFYPFVKNSNNSLYAIDCKYDTTIEHEKHMLIHSIFDYLIKYPNIKKIKYINEKYNENDYDLIKESLLEIANYELSSNDYANFKRRNISFSSIDNEFNIISLNKENLFGSLFLNLENKLNGKLNKVKNIYVPNKELVYSDIQQNLPLIQENLYIYNLLNNSEINYKKQLQIDSGTPSSESILDSSISKNWKGPNSKTFLFSHDRKTDLTIRQKPFENYTIPTLSEDEYKSVEFGTNIVKVSDSLTGEETYKKVEIEGPKINIIDMDIGNKTFLDLMSILGKTMNHHLFSLDSEDMTQKNLMWYLFSDLYKNKNDLKFKDNNKINYLNIILQEFKGNFDFLNKKYNFQINNVIDFHKFMQKTYNSENELKDIIEIITTRSYFNQTLSNFPNKTELKKEKIDTYNMNGIKLSDGEKIFLHRLNDIIYHITMNDSMKFQNNDNLRTYIKDVYYTVQDLAKELSKEPRFENIKLNVDNLDTKNSLIMDTPFFMKFKENIENIFKWYDLNNELLYGISTNKVNEFLLSVLNDEITEVNMYNYEDKLKKYKDTEPLKEQIEKIINDKDFKDFLEYSNAHIYQDDTYHLDVKKAQHDIIQGRKEFFPTVFKALSMEDKQSIMKAQLKINQIYSDDLNATQKEILQSLPVSGFFDKVLANIANSTVLDREKTEAFIGYFMENKDAVKSLSDDDNNNFIYYFNLIFNDINTLYTENKIDIVAIEKIEKYIIKMMTLVLALVKRQKDSLQGIYFQYYTDITLNYKDAFLNLNDLKYVYKFEEDILAILIESGQVEEEIIDYLKTTLRQLEKKVIEGSEEFNFFDNNDFKNNSSLVKPFLFYKLITDYVNIQSRFENNSVIEDSVALGKITGVINKEEYVDSLIEIFQMTKPLFANLVSYEKIKSENSENDINSSLHIDGVYKNIQSQKDNILSLYQGVVLETLNKNFNRVYEFLNKSYSINSSTSVNLITAELEEKLKKIKEDKEFYSVANQAYFMSSDADLDNPRIVKPLLELAKRYKISLLFGTYNKESVASKTSGNFNFKQDDIIRLDVKASFLVDSMMSSLTLVNDFSLEDAYQEKTLKITKINFTQDINVQNVKCHYGNKEPLSIGKLI